MFWRRWTRLLYILISMSECLFIPWNCIMALWWNFVCFTTAGLLIPSVPGNAVDKAVGIVGAVIMPHNIFLHSALVQSRNIDITKKNRVREALRYYNIESAVALFISFLINLCIMAIFAKAFFGKEGANNIGLANAGEYLQQKYGEGFFPILYIWAIGLLAAGQSSTMTGTYTGRYYWHGLHLWPHTHKFHWSIFLHAEKLYKHFITGRRLWRESFVPENFDSLCAGQFVMGGFLNLPVKKWVRVVVTRAVAIVPTVIVALIFNSSENELDRLSEWLNVLQSIQLPFALIPLLCLVSNTRVMGVFVIDTLTKVQ